ncbi:sulfite exporter TauE/SafE family protein [Longitalea luteola]|uniref:sulfite exporter TauE/SafE family protein n=1 Tax=Longitalea luteola TaxID=2812563 RepID=UPI001A958EEB|nr:sulfite exporter TauE/SafE family protein [Longitalea luteola]
MEIAGYLAAVLIGASLGLIGGGGSILTVPVFVYLLHVHPVLATTYSLFVVGSCSLVGGARAYSKKLIDFHVVVSFGLPSLLSVFLVRRYILPAIPDRLFAIGDLVITKGIFLMVLFALLMLVAAVSMIRSAETAPAPAMYKERTRGLLLQGLLIGAITGLLGAGGGFLIIPALVLISRLPMKIAVGSSLTIMAISSFFGFFSTLSHYTINWGQLLVFTAIAVGGIFMGTALSDKIPGQQLKRGFGWFVLATGLFILVHELLFT